MKSKLLLSFLPLVLVVSMIIVGGCAKLASTPTPTEAEWPDLLKAATPGLNSPDYLTALAWAPVHEAQTGASGSSTCFIQTITLTISADLVLLLT